MNIQPRHIMLLERKVLAARLVQIEAALPLEPKFKRLAADLAYARLDKEPPLIFIKEKPKLEEDKIQLDDSLASFLDRLQSFAQVELADNQALLSDLKHALVLRATAMACASCSKFPPQVCNGTDIDLQIVNAGAACLAPLEEMFDIAHEIARHYYVAHGMSENPEVIFGTQNFCQREPHVTPHGLPVPYFVDGETKYMDEAGQMRARVVLKIPVRAFDIDTYLSTLYVLFHECIVHAFRCITSGAPRRGTKDADRFLEGWMDWISFEILKRILGGMWPISRPRTLKYLTERLHRATRFHEARFVVNTPSGSESISRLASGRETGRKAAIKVHNLFQNRGADAWEKVLKMSLELNMMSSFDSDKREAFVSVLDFLQDDDNAKDLPPEHDIVAGIVTKYLLDNDLQDLINSAMQLESEWT
jgi:hypothetical protein